MLEQLEDQMLHAKEYNHSYDLFKYSKAALATHNIHVHIYVTCNHYALTKN